MGAWWARRRPAGCQDVALYLSSGIAKIPAFELWNDGSDIPVFAWRLREGHTESWTLYDLSDRLRARGWLVPAYPMPDSLSNLTVQRIVVRNGMSMDLAASLLEVVEEETAALDRLPGPLPHVVEKSAFHH